MAKLGCLSTDCCLPWLEVTLGALNPWHFSGLPPSRLPVLEKTLGWKSGGQGHERVLFNRTAGAPRGRLADCGVGWPKHLLQPLWPSQLLEMEMHASFPFSSKVYQSEHLLYFTYRNTALCLELDLLISWIYIASLFPTTSFQQIYTDKKNIATKSTTANFPVLTLIMPIWFIIYHLKRIFLQLLCHDFFLILRRMITSM